MEILSKSRTVSVILKGIVIEIVEAELCPDHIHMLVKMPPKYSVSQIMGYRTPKTNPRMRRRLLFVAVSWACVGNITG